jgi:hypothetical protein
LRDVGRDTGVEAMLMYKIEQRADSPRSFCDSVCEKVRQFLPHAS